MHLTHRVNEYVSLQILLVVFSEESKVLIIEMEATISFHQ